VPDIRIRRDHDLGLDRARKVAWEWAEQAERDLGMECTVIEGETSDTVAFVRSGCRGNLIVAADHFDLDARLGLLLGAFSGPIEAEIRRTLDALLGAAKAAPGARRRGPTGDAAERKAAAPKPARRRT
jgi:putative polyhydroxyalkanoate system protein